MGSLGRGALMQADWPERTRTGLAPESFDPALLNPIQTWLMRNEYGEASSVGRAAE